MAYADDVFIKMCREILDGGQDTSGELVRPHWEDGTPAYTIKKFGVCNRYDLRKEFPIMTLRRTAIKSATDELLWIWQKKSNNIHDLGSHIWDEWADEDGSIGKAYGYQMSVKHKYKEGMFDMVDRVIWDLKHNPYSRRIMTNIYNFQDLSEMHLYPCAYSMTFNCTKNHETGKLVLNAILNQRSQDVLAANNWNVVQYAVLVHMIAQVCGMEAGELVLHIVPEGVELKALEVLRAAPEADVEPGDALLLRGEGNRHAQADEVRRGRQLAQREERRPCGRLLARGGGRVRDGVHLFEVVVVVLLFLVLRIRREGERKNRYERYCLLHVWRLLICSMV